jgi:polyhydroxyalkanoate synthesis regulator protein
MITVQLLLIFKQAMIGIIKSTPWYTDTMQILVEVLLIQSISSFNLKYKSRMIKILRKKMIFSNLMNLQILMWWDTLMNRFKKWRMNMMKEFRMLQKILLKLKIIKLICRLKKKITIHNFLNKKYLRKEFKLKYH